MSTNERALSRDTFDHLIARAIELDERGQERLNAALARQIAQESGISLHAWDDAMLEHAEAQRVAKADRAPAPGPKAIERPARPLLAAAAGLGAGAFWGAIVLEGVRADPLIGVGLIAASLAHVVWRAGRDQVTAGQTENAAWWAAIPAGIMVGMQEVLNDPIWFAGLAWAGTAAVGAITHLLLRRRRASLSRTLLPTRTH
jgi:hypothetical protein